MKIKQERERDRLKMKEDIKNKMKEKQRFGGGEVKVELVGIPSFMQE